MVAVFEGQRTVLEPNRWLLPLALSMTVVGAALTTLQFAMGLYNVLGAASGVFAFGLIGLLCRWTGNLKPRCRSAQVHTDAAGLHLDGALRVKREAIARAFMQPRDGSLPLVCVRGRRGAPNVDVVVLSEEDGARLLTALQRDVSRQAVTFRGPSPVQARKGGLFLAGLGFFVSWMCLALLLRALGVRHAEAAYPLPLLMLGLALFPSTISVGSEGVLTSWFGVRRLYSYDDVASVSPSLNGVALQLKSGRAVHIATSAPRGDGPSLVWGGSNRDAVWARIEEARRAFDRDRDAGAQAIVARGGRTVTVWLQALRALPSSSSYRQAALPVDALWRIAEDPAAESTARAGAAVALRHAVGAVERGRLRVAAEASVLPKLRVALQAASADDDQEIEAALEALDHGDSSCMSAASAHDGRNR